MRAVGWSFQVPGFFPLLRKLLLSVLHIQLRVAICEFLLLALDRLGLDSIRVLGRGLECEIWRRKFLEPH